MQNEIIDYKNLQELNLNSEKLWLLNYFSNFLIFNNWSLNGLSNDNFDVLKLAEMISFTILESVIKNKEVLIPKLEFFFEHVNKTSFVISNAQLLGLFPINSSKGFDFSFSEEYYQLFAYYYTLVVPYIINNSYFNYYIYQSSFYPHGNLSALIQMYFYWIGIFENVQTMIKEISYLKINWNEIPGNIYFNNYNENINNIYHTAQYSNSFGQRYHIQWDWEEYVPWFFDVDHQNFNPWNKLNSWILQSRRFSLDMFQLLYAGSYCNEIYNFEDALEIYQKKLTAKIKFRGYRKNIYLLNNILSETYLKHRDYIQKPSFAIGNFWWNNFPKIYYNLTDYRQNGLIVYWYEHFYSIEIPIKCYYAYWYQMILPHWWWSLYFTDGYLSGQSWQSISKLLYYSYMKLYSFYITDEKNFNENGDRIVLQSKDEEFTYLYQKNMWHLESDLETDNIYLTILERKKYEEFLELKNLIDTTRITYKDPFDDYISPGGLLHY